MAKPSIEDVVFISIPEASKKFGYTKGGLYNLVKTKKVTSKDINGRVYISALELETRFEKNKNRIGSNKKSKKNKKKVVVSENVRKTETTNFQTVVLILSGVLGTVIGFLIATLIN